MTLIGSSGLAPQSAHPVNVTAAGFPFKLGEYVTEGTCNRKNFHSVEFMKTGSHEYEADGGPDFKKIIRTAPGHYIIDEVYTDDDDDSEYTYHNDYQATGPGTFQRTEHVAFDNNGNPVKRDTVTNFRWCPAGSLP
jgi:hypothetical protein